MRILVTGATGFLGSHIVPLLAARGHQVVVAIRPESHTSFSDLDKYEIEMIPLNLSEGFVLDDVQYVDAVMTLAQERTFREFPNHASRIFEVNTAANVRIWEWACRIGVRRLIHASSGGIYGTQNGVAFTEASLPSINHQNSYYLRTKLCAEIAFQVFSSYFESAVLIRPFFIYGPGQTSDKFVQRMISQIGEGRKIQIATPDGIRTNPIFVSDAAEVFADSLNLTGSHVLNCAGSEILSLRQLCKTIGSIMNQTPHFEITRSKLGDCIGDIQLQTRMFGAPKVPLIEGLRLAVKSTPGWEAV